MKKIFFTLGTVLWVSLVCFAGGAQASSGAADSAAPAQVKVETFTGKVDSAMSREEGGKKYQQVTIRSDEGIQTVFVVAPDAPLTGSDGSSTSLNWVKGNRVTVEYVTAPDGYTRVVKSLKVLS